MLLTADHQLRHFAAKLIKIYDVEKFIIYEVDDCGKVWARHGSGIDIKKSIFYEGGYPHQDEIINNAIREKQIQIILRPLEHAICGCSYYNK